MQKEESDRKGQHNRRFNQQRAITNRILTEEIKLIFCSFFFVSAEEYRVNGASIPFSVNRPASAYSIRLAQHRLLVDVSIVDSIASLSY